jgi:hypothetical protein
MGLARPGLTRPISMGLILLLIILLLTCGPRENREVATAILSRPGITGLHLGNVTPRPSYRGLSSSNILNRNPKTL